MAQTTRPTAIDLQARCVEQSLRAAQDALSLAATGRRYYLGRIRGLRRELAELKARKVVADA